jgi:peptidoglycan/LPS O-acetylase OafA/YrhL
MTKKYFPGLNGLRFFGAFAVILGHIEFIKSIKGYPNIADLSFYKHTSGHIGVLLFFVLSGFLITYLLLSELNSSKTIAISKFYMRRFIRTWPLYFLMVFFALYIYPLFLIDGDLYPFREQFYYLILCPNVAKSYGYFINGIVHLWSIGVEEQFYFIWPFILLLFRKNQLLILSLVFIGMTFLPTFLWYSKSHYSLFENNPELFKRLDSFIAHFKIHAMALGGIIAYIVFFKKKWLIKFEKDWAEILIVLATFSSWILGVTFGKFSDEIYSILFGLIIYIIVSKKQPMLNLEFNLFDFLGRISYGLYVYHWIIILITLNVLDTFIDVNKNQSLYNILLYIVSISATVFISHLSFKYFEKPILRLKTHFQS